MNDETNPETRVDELSLIRQAGCNQAATVSAPPALDGEATVPTSMIAPRMDVQRTALPGARHYCAAMTTANDIAVALLARVPHISDRKLHAMLYLAQGLCLAANGAPLFADALIATNLGVRVEGIGDTNGKPLTDAEHAVVAVAISRYGSLPAMDLEALIRGQGPWQVSEPDWPVELDVIREFFRTQDDDPEGTMSGIPRSHRSRPGAGASHHSTAPDDPEEIADLAAEMRSRM